MIIDFHCHIFPNKTAARALEVTSQNAGKTPTTNGTVQNTIAYMNQHHIDFAVTLPVCTREQQHDTINRFAQQNNGGRFIAFGGVYPKSPDAVQWAQTIKSFGLKGVKIHPDYQDFMVDDPTVFPLYEALGELGLIAVFHTGPDPVSPNLVHCEPGRLAKVAKQFPKFKIVAAHLGGVYMHNEVLKTLCGIENVWLDTSLSSQYSSPEIIRRLVSKHGSDRILFASDTPWSNASNELKMIDSCGFTSGECEAILYKNAKALLNL